MYVFRMGAKEAAKEASDDRNYKLDTTILFNTLARDRDIVYGNVYGANIYKVIIINHLISNT